MKYKVFMLGREVKRVLFCSRSSVVGVERQISDKLMLSIKYGNG